MKDPSVEEPMVAVQLARIVVNDNADSQFIFLREVDGTRGFPIVIGANEAAEITRVVKNLQPERPLTHQLAHSIVQALGHRIARVDIVDLRNNTFFAQLVLQNAAGETTAIVDARPSDALALALRAKCPVRVAARILDEARGDKGGPDVLEEE